MSFWDQFTEEIEAIGRNLGEWLPKIIVAILVLIIGRWIIKWIRRIVVKLLDLPAMQTVWEKSGVTAALAPSGNSAAQVTGIVASAFLYVVLWLVVFRILELQDLVDLLERLLAFIPLVILAAIVVIISAAVASWTADLVRPFAESRDIGWLTWLTRVGIIIFGVLFALDILEVNFASNIVMIVIAAFGIAFAVAFGIGGIDTAKQWWARYAAPRERGTD